MDKLEQFKKIFEKTWGCKANYSLKIKEFKSYYSVEVHADSIITEPMVSFVEENLKKLEVEYEFVSFDCFNGTATAFWSIDK